MPIRASVPLQRAETPKFITDMVSEFGRGAEDPARDISLQPGESTATGIARFLKMPLDYTVSWLKKGAKGVAKRGVQIQEGIK